MKKILSILLSLVLVLVPMISADAADTAQSCPTIEIPGFMSNTVYSIAGDADSGAVWPPATDAILETAKKVVPDIALLGLNRNWDRFAQNVCPKAQELLSPACCDVNGEITNGTGICFTYPAAESVTPYGTYTFDYDWRADPLVIADELNAFIDYILASSGASKVNVVAHSLGGVILLSYLTVYGDAKIRGACFYLTAIYGESYNGQLMSGQLSLNADSITEYMRGTFADSETPYLLASIFDVLNKTGILDAVCACGNYAVDQVLDYAAHDVVLPMFAQWLTIWAMVPDEYIDSAMDYVFNNIFADDGIDHSGLLAKVEAYNDTVRAHREETLRKLNEHANVIVFSAYGYSPIPVMPDWKKLSDNNVDTRFSSFGAVTAPYGEKLSEEALASADAKYVNPDKNIDASACLFPEQTWFIKNQKHGERGADVDEMIRTLLLSETQPTTDTYERYPRFLERSLTDGSLTPDTEAEAPLTFLQKIVMIFKEIFGLIKGLFAADQWPVC